MSSGAGGGSASNGGGSSAAGGGSTPGTENCNNNKDDDGDDKTDCLDPDCIGALGCCVDLCTDGSTICEGGGTRQCQLDLATGCRAFAPAQACQGALVCSGGTCAGSCTNQCTEGATQCASSGAVVKCQSLASGCTDWMVSTNCATGQVCSGGACVPVGSCTDQCAQGSSRCTSGGQAQSCVKLPTGCTDWSLPVACASGQTCASGGTTCAPIVKCTPGATRCAQGGSAAIETCDAQQNWQVSQGCAQGCTNGMCTATASCTPGAVRCNGTSVESCNSNGTAWLFRQTCGQTCAQGVCTGPCTPGEKRCRGDVPEVCAAGGAGWTASTTCAQGCFQGACMAADLVVDGITTTLEGELAYANGVVVKNGGQLKVGPSGVLKIRAKTITVDAASNINANSVGQETRCQGGARSCSASGLCTATANIGACHGNTLSVSASCYYSGTRTCSVSNGATYDREDDLSVSAGSKYNAVPGGGLVQLVAENLQLDGQITANGGDGASGGGIVLAANALSGAGAVQAVGGGTSPAGGIGVVKVLHGATKTFTGSITGRTSSSVMPPLDLVSGTHPDPARWYNDGLGDWALAWSKPFASANGYYVKASTSEGTLPSQANGQGTFQQGETATVKAADLSEGANYFHVVSVDSSFNVGTVKASTKLNLNKTPPTVKSSSHPTERTWYSNDAVYLTWEHPQAAANFTGSYYAFDHFMDTVPSAASTFTPNLQVLLSGTQPGIWVFHVVNRDTRNALTKAARHFVVYVGTEPAKSNLSGSVFDASNGNAPLGGVTLKVNRGLFSASSTTAGTYTFANQLYVGEWEVTAEKAGYLPQTKRIDLKAGMPLNENFTLSKTN